MKLIIVSNRAPVSVVKENDVLRYEESAGGLASGLRAWIDRIKRSNHPPDLTWVGWPGIALPPGSEDERRTKEDLLKKFGVACVFLPEEVMGKFYEGFCNKTLWPLFHYFPGITLYDEDFWKNYVAVNKVFCDSVLATYEPGDHIWVHDYHLMLVPAMIREKIPEASIGFFLHIPFPSYEIFRMLPSEWRKKIIEGLYGADLIGFHTHDYCTYFLQSTLRILGISHKMNEVYYNGRLVRADTFPMGIDFEKYNSASQEDGALAATINLGKKLSDVRLVLSIDRQDYSKGIMNRLRGYEHFLNAHPGWKNRVTMIMVVVPSRIGVESYQDTKSQIDELVGNINGKFGSIEWMPILYLYRSLNFGELIALYSRSDVALVTPLRDGMNLIAKEYIASRTNNKGVLILSEMAGAVDELDESIVINPNNIGEISAALLSALEMKEEEQKRRITAMQQRVKNYDVFKWADNFLSELDAVKRKQQRMQARVLNGPLREKILQQFERSDIRLFFLDYDGTLIPHFGSPADAVPDEATMKILQKLSEKKHTHIILMSGRDKATLEKWFGHLPLAFAAEHGLFLKEKDRDWRMLKPVHSNWKKEIIGVMKGFSEKLPRSFIEDKEFSVAFHYRRSDPDFASLRVKELVNHLEGFTSNMDVSVHLGSKVVEVRNAGVDKGIAAMTWLSRLNGNSRFILAIGNDRTDEDLFRVLPKDAYSIKVGTKPSYARFHLDSPKETIKLLEEFI